MVTVRDAIHQDIHLSDLEAEIMSSPEFQRLRRIRQLGFTSLVYPSATHTRFEHSLGTMHLAGQVCRALKLDEKTTNELRLAGMLHDIGHYPFSHIAPLENLAEQTLGENHVTIGARIIRNSFSGMIKEHGLSSNNIINAMQGKGKYGSMLSGGIDVDKMDYLVRDSHNTGTAYGFIDSSRLLSTVRWKNNTMCFDVKDVRNLESIMMARFMMFSTVYLHPSIKIAEAMFGRIIQDAVGIGLFSLKEFMEMDDWEATTMVKQAGINLSKRIADLNDRRTYKSGALILSKDIDSKTRAKYINLSKDQIRLRDLEKEIAEELKLDDLIINIDPKLKTHENIFLLDGSKLRPLEELSSFTKTLDSQQFASWKISFCTPSLNEKIAEKAKKEFLGRV